jgi:hypothetical protein
MKYLERGQRFADSYSIYFISTVTLSMTTVLMYEFHDNSLAGLP